MALTPGTRLGPYEIAAHIGEGGMGEVYRARDTRLDRTVAIKVLPQHVASDPEVKQRFEREAKTISSLNHPHICTLHDVGSQDGIDFLVLEYLDGETLAQRLTNGPLPLDQGLQYAMQVADALAKGHRQGIVHRDLKPGNIMLTKSGAKLLDFGLAKRRPLATVGGVATSAAPTVSSPITGAGSIVGTFQYMAPEQLEGKEADARTDIFAFGAVLYEMLTGKKAFEGKSQASLIAAILDHQPAPPSAIQQLTPPAVDHVVATCLAKDPDERWQSASDLVRELTWIADSPAATGGTHARVVRQPWWRQALPLVAASSVVGLMVGLVTWRVTRPAAETPVQFAISGPPGLELCCPSITPDGRTLAFRGASQAQSTMYLRRLEQLEAVSVPGSEGNLVRFPAGFSPDGQRLLIEDHNTTLLSQVPLTGGPGAPIGKGLFGGADWGPDDVVVYARRGGGLSTVPASGGEPTRLTALRGGEMGHYRPLFLPDGRAVLFFISSGRSHTAQVAVYDLDAAALRVLLPGASPQYVATGHLIFWRDGSLWAVPFDPDRREVRGSPVPVVHGVAANGVGYANYSVGPDGTLAYMPTESVVAQRRTLVWVDRNGREDPIPMAPRPYKGPRLSPDGRRLVVDTLDGDLFLYDLDAQVEEQFTFDLSYEEFPLWSPDGSRIYFSSTQDGPPTQLYVKPADGSRRAERVLTAHINGVAGGWSADGEALVFSGGGNPTGVDIFTVRPGADGRHKALLQTPNHDMWPTVSPNGRWLAYVSDETGARRIHVRPLPDATGSQRVISDGPGERPVWGRDGRELFYHTAEGVMAVPVETGATFRRGTPIRLFSIEPYVTQGFYNWDIAPDGRFLMVKPAGATGQPPQIIVALHWLDELKRLVPAK